MSHWIFQGNPDRYDVDTYIRENTEINWLVSQTHHECFDPLLRLNLWPVAAIIALISSLMGLYSLVSADDNTTDISGDPRNLASRLSFSEISQESNQIYQGCAYSDAWSDYDNDGLIDLFVPFTDRPDALCRNLGDGTFADVVESVGIVNPLLRGGERGMGRL